MSGKTAEEKLRQELEGSISTGRPAKKKNFGQSKKTDSTKVRKTLKTGRNIIDSFMEDFEKKIEESLEVSTVHKEPSERKVKSKSANKAPIINSRRKQTVKAPLKAEVKEHVTDSPKIEEIPVDVEEVKENVEDIKPATESLTEAPKIEEIPVDVEDVKENVEDVEPVTESLTDSPEIEEIPVDVEEIEENVEDVEPVTESLTESPKIEEIPVDVEEVEEPVEDVVIDEPFTISQESEEIPVDVESDFQIPNESQHLELNFDDFDEIENADELPPIPLFADEDEESEDNNGDLPDIPVISAEEFQDPDDDNDIPIIASEFDEIESESESESDEISDESSQNDEIVLNVDSDFPQNSTNDEEIVDPESEAVPVSVTMPESTKTAEDKLMADIAEAMTGSPLTLETPENYRLPENFMTAETPSESSQQSAEDKLRANIAQAMSESPLNAAQDNAEQDFEQDINSLEDFQLPELPEREEDPNDEVNFDDYENDPPETFSETLDLNLNNDEESQESIIEDEIIDSDAEEVKENDENEINDEEEENINDLSLINDGVDDDEISEPDPDPDPEPEITPSEPETEYNEPDINIDIDNNDNEEVLQENNMPEKSLLDDDINNNVEVEDVNDDWDISSLGALSEAASIPEHESEQEQEFNNDYDNENITPPSQELNEGEEENKEKIMGIREKLAARKNGKKDSSGNSGGFLTPLLLCLLIVAGGLIFWELKQLNDKLTYMNMNSSGFESVSGIEKSPSYEYSIDLIFDTNITERMTQRGREGWQVVGSRRTQDSITGQLGYEFIFMRKTPERKI